MKKSKLPRAKRPVLTAERPMSAVTPSNRQGFTLVQALVVIAIVAVAIVLLIPAT
jgi:type II secretory pathway pseudopilin PulG